MTGVDVKALRDTLGMTAPQFAGLLGVHSTTPYRWEQAGEQSIHVDPLHQQVLTYLTRQAEIVQRERRLHAWRTALLEAVLVGGTLAALALLLGALQPKPSRRRYRRKKS